MKFVQNKVKSIFGVSVEDFPFVPLSEGAFTNSRLFIAHNAFSSQIPKAGFAIGILATFNGKTSCAVVLNDTTGFDLDTPPAYPIVLLPGTKDCLVVTREPDTVLNLNATNRVITVPRR